MIMFLRNKVMRKVLLTTMFGALFATSSLSAKAQAGSVSGKVEVAAGVAFFSGVKTKGQTEKKLNRLEIDS